jgi:hypothetical protein
VREDAEGMDVQVYTTPADLHTHTHGNARIANFSEYFISNTQRISARMAKRATSLLLLNSYGKEEEDEQVVDVEQVVEAEVANSAFSIVDYEHDDDDDESESNKLVLLDCSHTCSST